jgi:phage baseplate assembly protein W
MAYRIENNNPLDTDYKLAVGVSVPFNADGVFNSVYTSTEQIRSNLINFVLTNKGERYLNPNYGSDLRKYLFSNITDSSYSFSTDYTNVGIKDLESQLKQSVVTNFPQIDVKSVTLTPTYDSNSVQISITYSFMMGANDQLIINI